MPIRSFFDAVVQVAGARARTLFVVAVFTLCGSVGSWAAEERSLTIDGSTTVFPITSAMAEAYAAVDKTFTAAIAANGSGAGVRLFLAGSIPIANSSRSMTPKEAATAAEKGLEVIELPIAYDGITLVVNPKNHFATSLTVDEVRRIWSEEGKVKIWKDVRAEWPSVPIALYGRSKESGTYDFFANAILGGPANHRSDYIVCDDGNAEIQGVVGNEFALGYLGYAFYAENTAMLKPLALDAGKGPVTPSPQTIHDGAYQPLSRPLFVYVDKAALAKPQIAGFLDFYLKHPDIVREIGYIPLDPSSLTLVRARLEQRIVGAPFATAPATASIDQVLRGITPMKVTATAPTAGAAASAPTAAPATVVASAATVAAAAHDGAAAASVAAPKPTPALTPTLTAAPAWQGPSAETVRQSIEQLRDRSLILARASLDDTTALAALDQNAAALKELTAKLLEQHRTAPGAATLTVAEALTLASADPAAYTAMVERLKLTDAGKTVVADTAFAAFKTDLAANQDAATRLSLARALSRITPEQVPLFAEALSRLPENPAWRSLDLVRCYAKAGLTLQ